MAIATTLSGSYFHDPAIFAQAQERISSEMCVCPGRADDIPNPGEYSLVELGGESIILVRGRDRRVRAVLSVCRHRGARLCVEPGDNAGTVIQCRYHAWSDWLVGHLLGAPNIAREEALDRDDFDLWVGRRCWRPETATAGAAWSASRLMIRRSW